VNRHSSAMLAAALVVAAALPQAVSAVTANLGDPAGNVNLAVANVVTGGVELSSPATATLTGTVDPNSVGTQYYFEYGPNGDMSLRTATVSLGSSVDPHQVTALAPGLQPGTAYEYRLVATGPAGLSVGATQAFSSGSSPTGSGKIPKSSCTIRGSAKNDVLRGTRKRDVICGLGGRDRISGLGGNDVIRGGGGNDVVKAGAGSDRVFGDAGNDALYGQGGADRLNGGKGRDRIVGGPGRDQAQIDKQDFKLRSVEKTSRR
jgi:RTX calcium-binding nonapeptide repeat (4 copies)